MNSVLAALNQYSGLLAVVLLAAVAALAAFSVMQSRRLAEMNRTWRSLLTGVDAENLEHLLHQHLEARDATEHELASMRQRLNVLESKMRTSKRFVGFRRYDAFELVGGEQSFSVVICDEDGNGMVISSQTGRAESRVFAKRLTSGKPDRDLSEEEVLALQDASAGRAKGARD